MPSSKLKKRKQKRSAAPGLADIVIAHAMKKGLEMLLQGIAPGKIEMVWDKPKDPPAAPTTIDIPYEDVTHKRIEG